MRIEDVNISVLNEKCPKLFNSTQNCDQDFMSGFTYGTNVTVDEYIRNFSKYWNKINGYDNEIAEQYRLNRSVDDVAFYSLITVYAMMICFGSVGNSMVVAAVLRKKSMKTERNIFILNLAVSDLFLCLVTMPMTLMETLTKFWPLGNTALLCKLVGGLTGLCVFVSSMSITAIAVDRYQVVVNPTRENLKLNHVCILIAIIWVLSATLASPICFIRTLEHIDLTKKNMSIIGISSIDFCREDWPIERGGAYYSMFTVFIQYVFPIITVIIAYTKISRKLRNRMSIRVMSNSQSRVVEEQKRIRRTNILLISITSVYALSWIPLNLYNALFDFTSGHVITQGDIIYALCHMAGMSSACTNPILYGWLNDNFRKEFIQILNCPSLLDANANHNDTVIISSSHKRKQSHIDGHSLNELTVLTRGLTTSQV